jgi:Ca2+-binding EF-hand superfamily protein
MSLSDQQIQKAVDEIFKKVDFNHDNKLNLHEVISMMNMSLRYLGRPANATFHDAEEYINFVDTNKNHEISKEELFKHLKIILARYH